MKTIIFAFAATVISSCVVIKLNAQQTVRTSQAVVTPTVQRVIGWAKELHPKMQQLNPRLEKIQPRQQMHIDSKKSIRQVQQVLEEVLQKGKKLTAAEAAKYDTWFRNAMSKALQECLEQHPGSECCFSGQFHGQGWASLWYHANCFLSNFPDIN